MNQFLILLVIGSAFANAKEEPFSIGLGVLSPSYTQTVGKENVKVQFDQKEDGGFSYSVGDPKTGTNTFLTFGNAAGAQPAAPSGYSAPASNSASGYAAPAPAYNQPSGYAAPAPAYNQPSGYAAPAPAYNQPSGYAAPAPAYNQPSGYAAPAPAYNQLSGYAGPTYGYNNPGPQANGLYNQAAARKPEEGMGDILPAGFSYHATDGQAFLGSMGESPTFMVEDSSESARGPAEQSFYHNQPGLANGLVGYGPARGDLPIGSFAGPQYQGAYKEHGGHD